MRNRPIRISVDKDFHKFFFIDLKNKINERMPVKIKSNVQLTRFVIRSNMLRTSDKPFNRLKRRRIG